MTRAANGLIKTYVYSLLVLMAANGVAEAQEIRTVEPVSTFKSIESDDPLRYYNASDPGIPAGDINGDGLMEFIVQNPFYPDKSTPELGDYIQNTLVYTLGEDAEISYYSIKTGAIYFPAGDINGDGRDDLALWADSVFKVFIFGEGDYDITETDTPFFEIEAPYPMSQFVPGLDFDGDGNKDLLIGTSDYETGGFIHILFGGSTSNDLEFKTVGLEDDLGLYDIQTNAGDVVGNDGPEVVLLTTSAWPSDLGAAVYEVDSERNIIFNSTTDLGSTTSSASSMRFFVANVDTLNKADLIYSQDRYTRGAGLTQIYFNQPSTYVVQSNIGDSAVVAKTADSRLVPFLPPELVAEGYTIDQLIVDDPLAAQLFTLILWSNGNLAAILGADLPFNGGTMPSPQILTPGQLRDYYFQRAFFPVFLITNIITGTGNPQTWFAGRTLIELAGLTQEIVNRRGITFSSFEREIRSTRVIEPDPEAVEQFGRALMGYWHNTQYISMHTEIGIGLNITREEDEEVLPTETMPTGEVIANDLLGVKEAGGIHFFGTESSTWFHKAISPSDTVEVSQSILVTDFETFNENEGGQVNTNNIGDINSDGFDDLLMGSNISYASGVPLNKAWILFGNDGGFSTEPDVILDFSEDSAHTGAFGSLSVGSTIEALGDINGDEIDDFALTVSNAVYIYFGSETAFDSPSSFIYPDKILKPEIVGDQVITGFGYGISSGDFDGDDAVDVAVSITSGYGTVAPPTLYLFKGNGDGSSDLLLTGTRSSFGGTGDAVVSGTYGNAISFLPKEGDETHQDLLYVPGGFNGYIDAIIFEGGAEADSLPDIQLKSPNRTTAFGFFNGAKPGVGDLNGDGFYDILLTTQADYEDAFVSSRAYFFSPNADIIIDSNEETGNPFGYRLSQNYPNPFNPTTKIEFRLANTNNVTLKVFDILGREVATLLDDVKYQSGSHTLGFDASQMASGVYLYQLKAGSFTQTRKMTLIK